MFLRIGLRSLLAEGNVPNLAHRHNVAYTIYTTPEDALLLERSPAFTELRKVVSVQFSYFTSREIDAAHYGSHGVLWQRGVDLAQRNAEIVFFLIPDILYANGTLCRWIARFESGYRAVYTPGPQVVLETILPEIESRFPPFAASRVALQDHEVLDLLFRHLHPIAATMLRSSPRRVGHPEHDLRAVPGRGFVARVLCSQPFCFDPGFFFELRNFSPCDHLDRLAFEPCTTISIEPLLKHVAWYYRPWTLDGARLSQLGAWWHQFGPPGCRRESKVTYDFCHNPDAEWQEGRKRAIIEGHFFRGQLFAANFFFTLFVELIRLELHEAAQLLSVAVYVARLRRTLTLKAGAVLLIPSDDALSSAEGQRLRQLITSGDPREVADRLRDHILPYRTVSAADAASGGIDRNSPVDDGRRWVNANGVAIEEIAGDVKVLAGPHALGDFTLYVIDRVLWRQAAANDAAREPAQACGVEPAGSADSKKPSQSAPASEPTTRRLRTWARSVAARLKGSVHQAAADRLAALTVLSQRVGRRVKPTFRPLLTEARHVVRRVLMILEPIPGVGRVSRLSSRVIRYAQVHGLSAAMRRMACGLTTHRPRAERLGWLVRKASAVGRHVRLHGWRATARTIARTLKRRSVGHDPALTGISAGKHSSLPSHAIECLTEIRLARGFQAAEQVLHEYETKVSGGKFASAPLELVRDSLKSFGGHAGLQATTEKALRALVRTHADWSEAWLELGYLMLDLARTEDALEAFFKAEKGRAYVDATSSCRDPRAQAAAARGRLLAALGRDIEARDAYAASLGFLDDQREVSAEYGMVLHRLGDHTGAVSQFFTAMNYGFPSWCVPRVGRDARRVTFTAISAISECRNMSRWLSQSAVSPSPEHSDEP